MNTRIFRPYGPLDTEGTHRYSHPIIVLSKTTSYITMYISYIYMSQTKLPVLSEEAVNTFVPWGLNVTLDISPSWPVKIAKQAPVMVLYTRACPSALAVTIRVPVVLKVTSSISSVWPLRVNRHAPLFTSQT